MAHVRKSHKKSRNGCIQCKRRRVKCDEKGPPCCSCSIRKLECTYANAAQAPQRSSAASSPSSTLTSRSHPTQPILPAVLHQPEQNSHSRHVPRPPRLQELRLMHHYSTATYKTLVRDETDLDIWKDAVPKDACKYEFLMDGILALASLHIALEDPEKRMQFNEYALSYHNSALKQFSETLPLMDPDNCNALFAFAVITALLTLAFCDSRIAATSHTPFDNILFISRILKGAGAVVDSHRQWLMSGKLRALFVKVHTPSGTVEETRGDAIESVRQVIFVHVASMDGEERVFYESAVGTLDACSGLGLDGVNIGALVTFPVLVDERLISHLSENKYVALMIFLYYGMLMSQLEDRWWARMFGQQLVDDVNSLIYTFHGQHSINQDL